MPSPSKKNSSTAGRRADSLDADLMRALAAGDDGAAASLLGRAGFRRGAEATPRLRALTTAMRPRPYVTFVRSLLAALPECPDPDQALVNLQRFAEARFGAGALEKAASLPKPLLGLLVRLFGTSQFLADLMVRRPELLDWLMADRELDQPRTVKGAAAQLAEAARGVEGLEPRRLAAIRAMRRELLRLTVRRIMGLSDEMEMARELSDLAQATLQHGLSEVTPELTRRFGWPMEEMADDSLASERRAGFVVIGMGKLGGRELNFSSDIDLIFVYSDEGMTSGLADGSGRITNHVFFTRLAEALTGWVMNSSEEGYFNRVDTRLRPDGETGPLARSLSSYEIYYTTQARLWERLALLKARAVAGDMNLGRAFESMCRPLVFDPLHSHELIHQIADLKQRIDHEISRKAGADREVKRGAGGIREIEFLVQTLQMLHGANNTRLWTAETLEALRQLSMARILPAEQAQRMREDYLFLRTIEHRLQMTHLRQTHTMPEEPAALDALAVACGIMRIAECGMRNAEGAGRPGERLMARWGVIAQRVHADFREFFERSERAAAEEESAVMGEGERRDDGAEAAAALILSASAESAILPQLAEWGINGGGALKALRRLGGMGRTMYLTPEGGLAFKKLLPIILRLLRRNPQPEKALVNLESFLYASGAIAGFYTAFLVNRQVFELLMLAFGSGAALSQTLIAHPEFLDIIADARRLSSLEDRTPTMQMLLARWTQDDDSPVAFCRALAKIKRLEFLLAGLGELAGLLDYRSSCDRMTAMATMLIEAALGRAAHELGLEAPPAGFAVLAMGKLGCGELNYYSDLDLVFAWDEGFAPGAASPGETAAALANRVIELLSHPTPEGAPFNIDARLRPEGQSAPLAPPLSRYVDYYGSERAQTWELQSAMKLRPIAGDMALGRRMMEALSGVIAGRAGALQLAAEMKAMRRRMEAAVKTTRWVHCDFKSGYGGVVDLEFIAQFLQLRDLHKDPALMGLGPLRVFERSAADGRLEAETARRLADDYVWLRRLERRTRLLLESEKTLLPASGEKLVALERLCAPLLAERGERALLEAVDKTLRRNRKHFEALVAERP